MFNVGELMHVVPVITPVDTTSTTVSSDVVGVKAYHGLEFLVQFGAITGDTAVITVEACDDTTPTTATAIAFHYRKSAATGTDSLGVRTAAAASGVTVAATDDNRLYLIEVDPRALTSGCAYVRVVVDPGASMSACVVGALALLRPRYAQSAQVNAVGG